MTGIKNRSSITSSNFIFFWKFRRSRRKTGNKKIDIQDNLFIENYPIQNNWRYKAGRSGIAQRNKYYRFDFNKNDVIFNFDHFYDADEHDNVIGKITFGNFK